MASLGLLSLPHQIKLVTRYLSDVFPRVEGELSRWLAQAEICPDTALRGQAKASILSKRFHAQGGSIYALYPGVNREKLIGFIVALQTISDYLDNLCDRMGMENEQAFRQVHLAVIEALQPGAALSDYYRFFPHREDGGYLKDLVLECRMRLMDLPSYPLVQNHVLQWARLYGELQTYKHLSSAVRETKVEQWARSHLNLYPKISCWEFGAASGSTLGIFILCAAASSPHLTSQEISRLKAAYFPWITGLHILLDYFIDQEEDRKEGDLNFIFYYKDGEECCRSLSRFVKKALKQAAALPHPFFHLAVVNGLLAMYLSDPKAAQGPIKKISSRLITKAGIPAMLFHKYCQLLRRRAIL